MSGECRHFRSHWCWLPAFLSLFLPSGITLDNLLAGLEIAYSEHIKVGHFIRLGSGETGHITKISWTRTVIRTNEGNLVIIPNYKLMANIIINHGSVDPGGLGEDVEQTASVGAKTHRLIDTLSDREREVLALIGTGATNREIAEKTNYFRAYC